jgi:chromosome segregation ATPase
LIINSDRIRIQENGYMLLKKQVELNAVRLDSKKIDIQELKDELKQLNEPFRSGFEIEQLKGDIRSLTNEKAELEYKISKSKPWPCKKCTYRNSNESIKCKICNAERYGIY